MPNWSALHPLRGDRRYAFEELTYQIAKVLYADEGQFIRVDDVGGSDGVEFYLRRPDETEWGWQSKFFQGDRLTASRKNQIVGSLQRACQVHPALRQWILCTHINFTPAEQAWFEQDVPQVIPAGMNVQLRHWADSDYAAWLAEPRFAGKIHFFFGELELNLEWFNRQFDRQTASLRDRFNPGLHTETEIDNVVHNLLGDHEFGDYVDTQLSLIDGRIDELRDAILRLEREPFTEIDWGNARDDLTKSSTQLLDAIGGMRRAVADGRAYLAGREFTAIRDMDLESAEEALDAAYEAYIALAEAPAPTTWTTEVMQAGAIQSSGGHTRRSSTRKSGRTVEARARCRAATIQLPQRV